MEAVAQGDELLGVPALDEDWVLRIRLGRNWTQQSGQFIQQGHVCHRPVPASTPVHLGGDGVDDELTGLVIPVRSNRLDDRRVSQPG